jgi:hypothetical protein
MHNTFNSGVSLPSNFFFAGTNQAHAQNSDVEHDDAGREPLKEQAIWQAVILQAITDAMRAPTTPRIRKEKTQAIIWFSITNKDFLLVCEMAGIDPNYILKSIRKVIKCSSVINRRKQRMKRIKTIKFKKQVCGQTDAENSQPFKRSFNVVHSKFK